MMKQQLKMQDALLNEVRKKNIKTSIYLINGTQLTGTVTGFDNYIIILKVDGKDQMLYKHAISTIVPEEPLKDLFKE
ncbi:MAG TPA: RNA chaperone Hfq [Halanaerobiaceae bacterium]|nr:RNA chaperone Hfq [Bacillota bacterium]HHU92801.1 RNA chaperone Hfq [Halanaerobiaceae bacterium]